MNNQPETIGPYKLLPEDEGERKQFEYSARTLGDRMLPIIASLQMQSAMAPPHGSFGKMMAIHANELSKVAVELKELRTIVAKGTTWVPGNPRLADESIQAFVVKIGNGQTRELHWLENAVLDSQGDEDSFTGWHTCRKAHGYEHFYEPYKGKVTHYLAHFGRHA